MRRFLGESSFGCSIPVTLASGAVLENVVGLKWMPRSIAAACFATSFADWGRSPGDLLNSFMTNSASGRCIWGTI
jgi:hypothetical protein